MKWKTERRKISQLLPTENNPRRLTDAQAAKLRESLAKFDLAEIPAINTDGRILAGHMRLRILRELKGDIEVDVRVPDRKLTQQECQEYLIRSNANTGEWDWDILANEFDIADLDAWGLQSIDEFLPAEEPEPEQDEVPEPPKVARTERGRIYQLGEHRLMCGDSTNADDVGRLMGGEKADMVFTDPPYGMNAVTKSGVLKKRYGKDIMGDDNQDVVMAAYSLWSCPAAVWWGANYYPSILASSGCWLVWDKNNGASDQADAELAWTTFDGVVRKFTLASEKTNRVHPTQKPVALVAWVFSRWSAGGIVADPFGGSGTTLIACEQTGRKCRMMELDPIYCDVIVRRWCNLVGADAEAIFDGKA